MAPKTKQSSIRVGALVTASAVVLMMFLFFIGSEQKIFSRKSCAAPAGDPASWTSTSHAAANASPGAGPLSTGQNRICITEVADSPTNSNFEFIEIFVE